MIRRFTVLLAFSLPFMVKGQDTLWTYFDANWKETTKEKMSFYRKGFQSGNVWGVLDFFPSGQLQMTGSYKTKKMQKRCGSFTYYHENGQVKSTGAYDKKGKKSGVWTGWHKNGNMDYEGAYIKGKLSGEWRWYFESGKLSAQEVYKNNNLQRFKFWNEDGEIEQDPQFMTAPEFPGGMGALQKYLRDNLTYPTAAQNSRIQGKVYVQFYVSETGEVYGVQVMEPIHPLLDEEARSVVEEMPNWKPGKMHNRIQPIYFKLPLVFQL